MPLTFQLIQPDGVTTFMARVWGDELAHGLETSAGYSILQDSNSYWVYAILDRRTGQLAPTDRVVGRDAAPASARGVRPQLLRAQQVPVSSRPLGVTSPPVLVILVQYDNRPAVTQPGDWAATVFGETHSVRHYYREVSYQQLTLVPATEACGAASNDGVTGWITLGTTHPNSGGPSIARAALKAVDDCVNYAAFDTNGDGSVTPAELLPIIIVAGYEASYGGSTATTPNIWGHQGWVNYNSVSDRVTILPYTQFGEWHAASWDSPGHRATMGLMVHELGHLLGWPDLYDNNPPGNPDSEGVGDWSVMGTGLWLGQTYLGDTPAHPSAWEKWYQGWLTPLPLHGTQLQQAIPRVEDQSYHTVIELLDNPGGVDWRFDETSGLGEYFLVENRQKVGYDARLPGCGLLVWHIDESVTYNNWANADENHKLVDLEEADGLNHLDQQVNRGDAGDTYPGSSGSRTFLDTSQPNSKLYDSRPSGVAMMDVSPGCEDVKNASFVAPAAMNLTQTAMPTAVVGQVLTFTLVLANPGPFTADHIVLTDRVPPHTTLNPASLASDATYAGLEPGSLITWTLQESLAPAASLSRSFAVTVGLGLNDGTALLNTAYFASTGQAGSSTLALTIASPRFQVAITPYPALIEATTPVITYVLFLNNIGHAAATGVVISNTIPPQTVTVPDSVDGGGTETAPGSGVLTWPPAVLAAGSVITRTFQVAVAAPLSDGDRLSNVVSVSSAQGININNLSLEATVGQKPIYLPQIKR